MLIKLLKSKKHLIKSPKIEQLYHKVDTYVTSYQSLEKENKNIKKEIANLQSRNENLKSQNNFLTDLYSYINWNNKRVFLENY